jgi:hypothetical protein
MTKEKLTKLESIIKPILEEVPLTRQDDCILFAVVCERLKPEIMDLELSAILYQHNELGVPNFESVGRCRRKIQAAYPELANPKTVEKRLKEQEAYKDYEAG